ncbi:leucyl/phenylalanyl-tRNA--protein transferase [Sulfitobacter mediterraneus]|uniref:Leucyl/phenylalanyl-tRNA--protein transferase n=1 Tax=Sulfitobacter mediterraneus TaxID=83219 RepID=A0A2T6CGM1_9RHOB|nr:leucyl/phenylalanyl-tRNA--protein transferase [Sulfitobacter mediterraneus]KIN77475.1 Leucyl/phenylalanyl-tRNA-protein transferase [Sulfitobacter mediterraneus KCTC 32188]PTX74649.1 leucyl/phenylalanyl-tRNA--protein transferase [Sulfitobacter mediterraneus]
MSELTPELLLHGYSIGIFPMAEHRDDPEIFWVDPRRRGVMPLQRFHLSRSLAKAMRRSPFRASVDEDFAGVVEGCADRADTWINDEIFSLYNALHQRHHAHSIEIWEDQTLVGGVYGVTLGGAFFGESMFSRRTNASKMALAVLVDRLRRAGFVLFDAQFLTDHLASLGAQEITRAEYHTRLVHAKEVKARFDAPPEASLYEVVQRMTQTS